MRVLILSFFLFIASCSSVQMVTVKNDLDEKVHFQGEFIAATNEVDNLEFQLKPGASNSWRYEVSSFNSDVLDKGLNKITLSSSPNCFVTLNRDEIEELSENKGMWHITITAEVIICQPLTP